jgi:hypothetical protein
MEAISFICHFFAYIAMNGTNVIGWADTLVSVTIKNLLQALTGLLFAVSAVVVGVILVALTVVALPFIATLIVAKAIIICAIAPIVAIACAITKICAKVSEILRESQADYTPKGISLTEALALTEEVALPKREKETLTEKVSPAPVFYGNTSIGKEWNKAVVVPQKQEMLLLPASTRLRFEDLAPRRKHLMLLLAVATAQTVTNQVEVVLPVPETVTNQVEVVLPVPETVTNQVETVLPVLEVVTNQVETVLPVPETVTNQVETVLPVPGTVAKPVKKVVNLKGLTLRELKAIADRANIKYNKSVNKTQLIKKIQSNN